MKLLLLFILLQAFTGCMGQYPTLKVRKYDPAKIDSVKLYRYKFLEFTDKMNSSHGRASARYQDSCEKYYKLLYRKP